MAGGAVLVSVCQPQGLVYIEAIAGDSLSALSRVFFYIEHLLYHRFIFVYPAGGLFKDFQNRAIYNIDRDSFSDIECRFQHFCQHHCDPVSDLSDADLFNLCNDADGLLGNAGLSYSRPVDSTIGYPPSHLARSYYLNAGS